MPHLVVQAACGARRLNPADGGPALGNNVPRLQASICAWNRKQEPEAIEPELGHHQGGQRPTAGKQRITMQLMREPSQPAALVKMKLEPTNIVTTTLLNPAQE